MFRESHEHPHGAWINERGRWTDTRYKVIYFGSIEVAMAITCMVPLQSFFVVLPLDFFSRLVNNSRGPASFDHVSWQVFNFPDSSFLFSPFCFSLTCHNKTSCWFNYETTPFEGI